LVFADYFRGFFLAQAQFSEKTVQNSPKASQQGEQRKLILWKDEGNSGESIRLAKDSLGQAKSN
jgi:hypothetical protein